MSGDVCLSPQTIVISDFAPFLSVNLAISLAGTDRTIL
jgi:hypothetical protein